ncbi:MAG: MGMT family protein [Gammaproteobacteria bacterium]|nr:MGMT family protein [Gammaproteobacteria bacterium]
MARTTSSAAKIIATDRPGKSLYARIYTAVRRIPRGRVSSYGRIARQVGGCTARQVGYAMAALPAGSAVPWHRVINHRGEISGRRAGDGAALQRARLESEGVDFDRRGRVDLRQRGWPIP